jgi:hypothetical protein
MRDDGFARYQRRGNGAAPNTPLRLVRYDDMQPQLAGGYFIKHLLGSTGMAVLYGAPGSGKTFFALWIGLSVAAEQLFFGRRVRPGGVLYIAAEAGRSIENRVAAAKQKFPKGLPFAAITSPIDLCKDDADLNRLIAQIEATELGMPIRFIIIDTLSRVLAGGNENGPEDMGALVGNLDRLREATGAFVLLVHHSGKDLARGARGHNLLLAATDTEMEAAHDKDTGTHTARVTKQRDYSTEGSFTFKLRQVDLGLDEDGDPVTSCVIEETDAASAPPRRAKLPAAQRRALQLLTDAVERAGEIPPASNHIPSGTTCVSEDLWRRYCYEGGISDGEQSAKRKAFLRAAGELVAAGRVGKWGSWIWPTA